MKDEDKNRIGRARQRYEAALHAVQSGVAMEENFNPKLFSPKHQRMGITSCQVTNEALATLLISKGIITEAEYYEAMAAAAENEQARWTIAMEKRLGKKVTLA